jgi:hypothetical protein
MLKHDYTIVCEFARPDAGGKWIIIGLFPNGIGMPQIPFPLPSLTFFQALTADAPGQYKFTAKLSQLESGKILANAQGMIQAAAAGPAIFPVTLGNLRFENFGMYTWSLEIEGQEPFLTEFKLALVPQQQPVRLPAQPPQRF